MLARAHLWGRLSLSPLWPSRSLPRSARIRRRDRESDAVGLFALPASLYPPLSLSFPRGWVDEKFLNLGAIHLPYPFRGAEKTRPRNNSNHGRLSGVSVGLPSLRSCFCCCCSPCCSFCRRRRSSSRFFSSGRFRFTSCARRPSRERMRSSTGLSSICCFSYLAGGG